MNLIFINKCLRYGALSVILGCMLFFSGCAQLSETSSVQEATPSVTQEVADISSAKPSKHVTEKSFERNIYALKPLSKEAGELQGLTTDNLTNEELMSLAQQRYKEALSFWENGKDTEAVRALDNAYLLLVQVRDDATADLKQQKETLRLDVSKRIQEINAAKCRAVPGKSCPIPIVLNREVQREIDRFLGPEKNFFLQSYKRSGKFREDIVNLLKAEGMPEELSWLPFIESGFQPRAVSPARAAGLWQFIATTGYRFGLKRDSWVDERMDPVKSSAAAIGYLKELHKLFGDWTTALAAYNCGEGLVSRVIEKQKINYLDNFWDLYRQLPEESARFVPRFLAVVHLVNNAEQYGLDLGDLHEAKQFETVSLPKNVNLDSVANKLGIYYSELSELNPALRRDIAPDGYELKVPFGYAEALAQSIEELPDASSRFYNDEKKQKNKDNKDKSGGSAVKTYVAKKGDTLTSIAAKYGVAVKDLVKANGWSSVKAIKPGAKLKIVMDDEVDTAPASKAASDTKQDANKKAQTAKVETPASPKTQPAKPESTPSKPQSAKPEAPPATKQVESKQASAKVVDKVVGKDDKKDAKTSKNAEAVPDTKSSSPKKHLVKKDDTLYSLSKRYNTTVDAILEMNGMKKNASIKVGQELTVSK